MKKLVAYLRGGLGNQCFIYAMSRSLADRQGAALCLDTSYFHVDKVYRRQFMLDPFNIRIDGLLDSPFLPAIRIRQIRYKFLSKHHKSLPGLRCENRPCRQESWIHDHRQPSRLTVDGYWQSEKYFESNSAKIYKDLQFKDASTFQADPAFHAIASQESSVFLHIRSYTDIPGKSDYSEALPVSYYQNALQFLSSKVDRAALFVFSDDIEWAKSRITVPATMTTQFIEPSGQGGDYDTYRDFFLMQQCRHGICANSSFSWWANWLGEWRQKHLTRPTLRICVNQPFLNDDYWPVRWTAIEK